ncbi:MAG: ribonuclease P protein component [Alphaproteobacteria bacterium]|nr:ribonuclease P protein component [Alphaproteobacteria bacterium]
MPRKPDIMTLKKRSEFLAVAASGKKWAMPGLVLQVKKHSLPAPVAEEPAANENKKAEAPRMRYGLTASKKVGNAVCRNRAKRRLRALANEILVAHAAPAHDYVLIARPAAVTRDYTDLRDDFVTALKRLKVWQEKTR